MATNAKVLKAPYRVYDAVNKEVRKFRTEKQARTFAKAFAEKATPVEDGYNTALVTHLVRDDAYGIIYENEVISYEYKQKGV